MSLPAGLIRVTRRRPCPVCGKADWCCVSDDGAYAFCPRTVSPLERGELGYQHEIDSVLAEHSRWRPHERGCLPPARIYKRAPEPPPPSIDWDRLHAEFQRAMLGRPEWDAMVERLGVPAIWLASLEPGWHDGSITFPMRDGKGRVVGMRRRWLDGTKRAVTGSRNGLYFVRDYEPGGPTVVVEGESDCAAALSLGLYAVGRFSDRGGYDMLEDVCVRRGKQVIFVADCDAAKVRPDGSMWWPGQEGAALLASRLAGLGMDVRVVEPMVGKDMRDWVRAGATRAMFGAAVSASLRVGGRSAA